MRAHLAPELFHPPISHALLVTFFRYALDGRHRIEVDLSQAAAGDWLRQQSATLREEIELAIRISAEAEALEPSLTVVEIGRFAATDFTSTPIRLRIEDARTFLETAVSLLVEDAISDRDFLMKMMTTEERAALQEQMHLGYVHFAHGGGLDNMRRRVIDRQGDPSIRHTLWVLFDSDAMQPGMPSRQSEALRAACAEVPHYQLSRRYMESYLPPRALHAWAGEGPDRTERRRRFSILDAYQTMRDEQRHHYNMKHGFARDRARTDASAGTLYDDVPEETKAVLDAGFDSQIGGLFSGDNVTEADLRRDSGWSELRPVVRQLLAQLR